MRKNKWEIARYWEVIIYIYEYQEYKTIRFEIEGECNPAELELCFLEQYKIKDLL